jgi:Mg2+ and Co2+ transporter CorA
VPVAEEDGLSSQGQLLLIAAGANWVLSVHREPIGFIDELRKREWMDSDLGGLSAESFVAALLDWRLSTYFAAFSEFEIAVERMEVWMNFDASFFNTKDVGFAVAAGVMLVLTGIALWFGRRRAWF